MAAGSVVLFDDFLRWAFAEGVNLDDGNVRVALCGQGLTPNASTQAVWADVSAHEIAHASYPAGGFTPATPLVVRSGATSKFQSDDIVQLFAGSDAAAKWVVFYYLGTVGPQVNPMIAYGDLDPEVAELIIVAGATLMLNCPGGAWFLWSK